MAADAGSVPVELAGVVSAGVDGALVEALTAIVRTLDRVERRQIGESCEALVDEVVSAHSSVFAAARLLRGVTGGVADLDPHELFEVAAAVSLLVRLAGELVGRVALSPALAAGSTVGTPLSAESAGVECRRLAAQLEVVSRAIAAVADAEEQDQAERVEG